MGLFSKGKRALAERVRAGSYVGDARRAYETGQSTFTVDLPHELASNWIKMIQDDGQWVIESTRETIVPMSGLPYADLGTRVTAATFVHRPSPQTPSRQTSEAETPAKPEQKPVTLNEDQLWMLYDSVNSAAGRAPNPGDEASLASAGWAADAYAELIEGRGIFRVKRQEFYEHEFGGVECRLILVRTAPADTVLRTRWGGVFVPPVQLTPEQIKEALIANTHKAAQQWAERTADGAVIRQGWSEEGIELAAEIAAQYGVVIDRVERYEGIIGQPLVAIHLKRAI